MASLESATRIGRLSSTISNSVAKLDKVLQSHGLQTPSFDEDASTNPSLPEEAVALQNVILDATSELHDLVSSPMGLLLNKTSQNNMVPFQFISHLGIAEMVPLGGQISFQEIAAKTGLNEQIIGRILRFAITMRVFREPEPGMLAHSNVSKAITDSSLNDWLKAESRDLWPAATETFDAVMKWPNSQEINETAFTLAHNTDKSVYDFFQANPDRALTFVGSLKALTSSPDYDVRHVIDNYDWQSLGHVQVVDVGGSRGNVGIQLAKNFSQLKVLVQDKEEVIRGAENDVPEEVKDRVSFAVHDIFCVIILRALVPALKHNARIIIQEACLPEPGTVPVWKESRLRAADLSMTALFNARDRTAKDWKALFAEADSRFVLESVIQPTGSALAMMDLRWNAED
ncbi:hypothetical protein NPX13_g7189 [Xylaria arbuscula]|uniref:O-methyltransferase domain-containing protein n=1 Tax=Xylaria arbuscula TaxID=114810 RepID=A0A9W8TJQ0_9PEZI|nr:hypothetical protein NPX13_g7189 [Xylaria arbuscula]